MLQEAAVIPTITVMDENSKVVTQIEPQQEAETAAGPSSAGVEQTVTEVRWWDQQCYLAI